MWVGGNRHLSTHSISPTTLPARHPSASQVPAIYDAAKQSPLLYAVTDNPYFLCHTGA